MGKKTFEKRRSITLLLCLAILAASGHAKTASCSEPGHAKPLLIGLIPEQNIFKQVERYDPLAVYLSEKCGIEIKLKILTRYGNIIRNFVSLNMDGAFFGSFTYALAHMKLGVEVLARPEALDGTSTYHGLIFVRKDSGIGTMRDMKGKRFAFVDRATAAGYLLPLAYFKAHGIIDYKTYFRETYFTGTHEAAIYDVLNKKADVGAAKNTIFKKISQADGRITDELVVLEKSPEVPENGLAVRKTLDDSIKDCLTQALLHIHEDPDGTVILKDFGARRFIWTTDVDYEPVFEYAREIELDLVTYDYMNQ
jgi:phosphonate transport system substrate-binding protein